MKKKSFLFWIPILLLTLCACHQAREDSGSIITKYYTLTLPENWQNQCIYELLEKEDGTYILNLYEKTSHEQMGAGNLCTLMLFSGSDLSYRDFPHYKLLASLGTPEGSYHVIALFPTDVQFQETTLESYQTLFAQLMDVLNTIRPVEGIGMAMP
jgi:hypothetical protein